MIQVGAKFDDFCFSKLLSSSVEVADFLNQISCGIFLKKDFRAVLWLAETALWIVEPALWIVEPTLRILEPALWIVEPTLWIV